MTKINVNKKLKILQIHDYPPFEGGGIEINVSRVSQILCDKGHRVIIATSRFNSETFNSKTNFQEFGKVKAVLINTTDQLKELIDWADIVNIHFTFSCRPASMLGLEYCIELKKPCVFSIRTNIDHIPFSALAQNNLLEVDEKLTKLKNLLRAENILISAPSNDVQNSLDKLGIEKPLSVITNGIAINPTYEVAQKEKVDITYIGEISFMKGINYLVDAIRLVKREIPGIRVRLIGGGSDLVEIKRMVQFFNLEKNIEFTGYVKNQDIPTYLRSTKIYVHPSLTETWANSVAEALAMNVPVICTNVGGLNELVQNGKFANTFNAGESQALYSEIIKVFKNKNRFKKLLSKTEKASDFIAKNYTMENQASQLINLYKEVVLTNKVKPTSKRKIR